MGSLKVEGWAPTDFIFIRFKQKLRSEKPVWLTDIEVYVSTTKKPLTDRLILEELKIILSMENWNKSNY